MNPIHFGDSIKLSMYNWAKDLFPVNRSLTGDGTLLTLKYFQNLIPELTIKSVKSGTEVFDWTVPEEWNVKEAWIKDENGEIVVDFSRNNLHLMGYSTPIHEHMDLGDLQNFLYSLPDQPEAIPYVTSYYKRRWGFCLSENQRRTLKPGKYEVKIDSTLQPGLLNYGEILIPGKIQEEVFLSTYVCHPSMANNELSGPVVTAALVQWLKLEKRNYSYRVVFVPETIGSIVYIKENLSILKKSVKAGFVLTCMGDERTYSYLASRLGDSLADKVARHVLNHHFSEYKRYSFLSRGSDERQYCSPGVDLPMCSIMRSKYGEYPEYHTSLDNLKLISPEGLLGGFTAVQKALIILENNQYLQVKVLCEPQLGKRGLYPTVGTKNSDKEVRRMINFITYCDGKHDLVDIAERINENALDLIELKLKLIQNDLIEEVSPGK